MSQYLILEGHPSLRAGALLSFSELKREIDSDWETTIQYVKNPDEDICLYAVKRYPTSVSFISKPSERVMLAAVKYTHRPILQHIKEPTMRVCIEAIKSNADNFAHVINPSDELCIEAIRAHPEIIRQIKRPTQIMYETALRKDGNLIRYIPQTEELCKIAVETNHALEHVRNQTREVCLIAINYWPRSAIHEIENLTLELCRAAYKRDRRILSNIPVVFQKELAGAEPPDPRR